MKKERQNVIVYPTKIGTLSEDNSAETALFTSDLAAPKNWFFSTGQRFSGMYSAEAELKEPCSVLKIFESERISTRIFWDFNPGKIIGTDSTLDNSLQNNGTKKSPTLEC